MTAGYLLKRKGIQHLIEAMPLVLKEFKVDLNLNLPFKDNFFDVVISKL